MKKTAAALMLITLLLLLCACGSETGLITPENNSVKVENLMTASVPKGFVLNESNDALSFSGIYYYTFTNGEGRSITNSEGNDALVYDCQIYLLAARCGGPDYALSSIAGWKALENEKYKTEETTLTAKDGSVYSCLLLTPLKDDSPFCAGAAVFIPRDNLVVSAEIYCCENFDGDIMQVLQQLTDSFVFTEQEN